MLVREVVEEREEDRKGLLHAQKSMKRPFAVELKDRLQVWWIARKAPVGDYVLACVVAFGGTVPEE